MPSLTSRFWDKVRISDTHFYKGTPCWEWTAYTNHDGYGEFQLNGKKERAHCLSYENAKGKIPDKLEIDHLCRNRKCVNADHLQAITHKENVRRD